MRNQQRFNQLLSKELSAIERQIIINYRDVFEEVEDEVARLFTNYGTTVDGKTVLLDANLNKYNRLQKSQERLQKSVIPLLRKNDEYMRRAAIDYYKTTELLNYWMIDQELYARYTWPRPGTAEAEAALKQPISKFYNAQELSAERTMELARINNALIQARARGLDVSQTARSIRGLLLPSPESAGLVYRSLRIARTETHRLTSIATNQAYDNARSLGIEIEVFWLTARDERVRSNHQPMDGRKKIDGYYDSPVGKIEGPGLSGVASFDISCRCTQRSEVRQLKPRAMRVRDEGIIPYQTFNEWKS